jgi:uncharacterized membrane protein YfcA
MNEQYWIGCIFFLAGFTQGVSGFGSALVAMPLLLFFIDVKTAVPLCMLNGLAITLFLSFQLRAAIDWKKIMPLIYGCLPGIVVGTLFLKEANNNVMKFLLGLFLLCYSLYALIASPKPRKMTNKWPLLAGFCTGVIGSAFSAGGPPTIIYTTLTGWTKDEIKATLSVFFFLTGILIAVAHALSGLTTITVLQHLKITVIFVLAGVIAGSICYGRISQKAYIRLIYGILIVMGIMMIVTPFISV